MGVEYSMIDYGAAGTNTTIVVADVDGSQHSTIDTDPETLSAPEYIDANIQQSEVSAWESYLEARGIPADWMSPSLTWREVLRTVVHQFRFTQRYYGQGGSMDWAGLGINLNTQWKDLPEADFKTPFLDAANTFGFDTSFIRNNTLVRNLIKNIADQFEQTLVVGTWNL
jgi:hypothetical protein